MSAFIAALHAIVSQAGMLSISMRADPLTVYQFVPIFKEDTYDANRMECFNTHAMEQTNPRTPDSEPLLTKAEKFRREGIPEREKARAKNDDPLIQIAIMYGVTAWRLGGWEDSSSTLSAPKFEKQEYKDMGVRSRILTHGWVYCRWGRARRFKDGKPDDKPETHGLAWRDGGFKEFTDVGGVVDWLGLESKAKARARARAMAEGWGEKGDGKERAVVMDEVELQDDLNEEFHDGVEDED